MRITNNHNLPESIYQAILRNQGKTDPNVYRVTDLINPPLMRHLKITKDAEIVLDASEFLWSILGQSVHFVLATDMVNALHEEALTAKVGEYIISGHADRYHDGVIQDYKVTSTWSFVYPKAEWEAQLNLYAFLYKRLGFPVNSLEIHAILRDWVHSKTFRDASYPKIPFQVVEVPLWTMDKQETFVEYQLALHNLEPVECSDKEKWLRGEKWAVMKKGRKTAVKLFDTELGAEMFLTDLKDHYVEHRPGNYVRCEEYCGVRMVCPYNKTIKREEDNE